MKNIFKQIYIVYECTHLSYSIFNSSSKKKEEKNLGIKNKMIKFRSQMKIQIMGSKVFFLKKKTKYKLDFEMGLVVMDESALR